MILTEMQNQAIEGAVKCNTLYRIGGYAGTGKTTIAKNILDSRRGGIVCAFTGKASSVLQKKGLYNATTIHNTIYNFDEKTNRFYKRHRNELNGTYFLIDEGSMVPSKLFKDIKSYDLPIIVIGDPGQLELIGENAKLMHSPDIVLDTIHRYDNSVAEFAQYVRINGEYSIGEYPNIQIKPKSEYKKPTQGVILTGFNKTRVAINKTFHTGEINEGTKLVVLVNNWDVGVNNGMLLEVKEIKDYYDKYIAVTCNLDNGKQRELLLWTGNLNKEKTIDYNEQKKLQNRSIIVDFGYALTCHKFQGSEDENITVIDEMCDLWQPARWRYTAVTRTSKNLTIYV